MSKTCQKKWNKSCFVERWLKDSSEFISFPGFEFWDSLASFKKSSSSRAQMPELRSQINDRGVWKIVQQVRICSLWIELRWPSREVFSRGMNGKVTCYTINPRPRPRPQLVSLSLSFFLSFSFSLSLSLSLSLSFEVLKSDHVILNHDRCTKCR